MPSTDARRCAGMLFPGQKQPQNVCLATLLTIPWQAGLQWQWLLFICGLRIRQWSLCYQQAGVSSNRGQKACLLQEPLKQACLSAQLAAHTNLPVAAASDAGQLGRKSLSSAGCWPSQHSCSIIKRQPLCRCAVAAQKCLTICLAALTLPWQADQQSQWLLCICGLRASLYSALASRPACQAAEARRHACLKNP